MFDGRGDSLPEGSGLLARDEGVEHAQDEGRPPRGAGRGHPGPRRGAPPRAGRARATHVLRSRARGSPLRFRDPGLGLAARDGAAPPGMRRPRLGRARAARPLRPVPGGDALLGGEGPAPPRPPGFRVPPEGGGPAGAGRRGRAARGGGARTGGCPLALPRQHSAAGGGPDAGGGDRPPRPRGGEGGAAGPRGRRLRGGVGRAAHGDARGDAGVVSRGRDRPLLPQPGRAPRRRVGADPPRRATR